ncbi:MAG: hypothetical protein QXJ11_05630 [Candidatus Bathyarchaeia archaeon]
MKIIKFEKTIIAALSVMGITLCLLLSAIFINAESTVMLAVFNILFTTLTFYLEGSATRKACLLLLGNACGFYWNHLFFLFSHFGAYYIGEPFKILYALINPFLNVMWTVFFWSISLTALRRKGEAI